MSKEQKTIEGKNKGCNPLSPFLWTLRLGNRFLVKPAAKKVDEQLDVKFSISRRNLLKAMIGTAGGSFFGGMYFWARSGEWLDNLDNLGTSLGITSTNIPPFVQQPLWSFHAPFAGAIANEEAAKMDFKGGTIFWSDDSLLKRISAHLDPQIVPGFAPETMKRKEIIYKNSINKSGNGWPNVICAIDAIESSGDIEAGAKDYLGNPTPDHAQGSMQVIPDHFIKNGITDRTKMRNPELNMEYAVATFKSFLDRATKKNTQYADVDPMLYLKALAGYNGGDLQVELKYNELHNETRFYWDLMKAMLFQMELASRLRRRGLSNRRIIQEMESEEIRARAYALWSKGYKNHIEYRRLCNAISVPDFIHPGVTKTETEELKGFYETYKRGYWQIGSDPNSRQMVDKLKVPLPPGLVLYYYMGGDKIASLGDNANPEKWFGVDTKRN